MRRGLVALALACLLGAAATPYVLRAVSPHEAVQADFLRDGGEIIHRLYLRAGAHPGEAVDPWGRPHRSRSLRASDPHDTPRRYFGVHSKLEPPGQPPVRPIYSTGPDGVDDQGRGDDLHVARDVSNLRSTVLAWAPEWLGGLTLLLLWLAAWASSRRRTPAVELVIVAVMLTPLLAGLGAALWKLDQSGVIVPDLPLVVVPGRFAVITSSTLLSILACVGVRLSAPRPGEAQPVPGGVVDRGGGAP